MKFTIRKFKTIENLSFEPPASIKGANKMGKTTILEAICFALTGKDLDGLTFSEIYDNRVELHEAVADVLFEFKGSKYRRVVRPIFHTSRDGVEAIKVLRSTQCFKNGLEVSDFSDEFELFSKFGTDSFFNLKSEEQRTIFLELMKDKLPAFDLKTASLQVKSFKKSIKETQTEIKGINDVLKNIVDVSIPEIDADLQAREQEYQRKIRALQDSKFEIDEINRENETQRKIFENRKTDLEKSILSEQNAIENEELKIESETAKMERLKAEKPTFEQLNDLDELQKEVKTKELELHNLEYYDNIQDYAKNINFEVHPLFAENIGRLKQLATATCEHLPEWLEVSNVCPTCGCESDKLVSDALNLEIKKLKEINKKVLETLLNTNNSKYLTLKHQFDAVNSRLANMERTNFEISEKNKLKEIAFETEKNVNVLKCETLIARSNINIKLSNERIEQLNQALRELQEPIYKSLPTSIEIDTELIEAHNLFKTQRVEQNEKQGVNKNNELIRIKKNEEKELLRVGLINVNSDLVELENQISNYFSNLNGIVKENFAGKIEINVQLQELVITKNEYKDVFKITANNNIFPYECNGAFKNNVKLQILRGLQKLSGYNGITLIDNTEANTTEALDDNGLQLVAVCATFDNDLIIEN